jgi:hypothetical protein
MRDAAEPLVTVRGLAVHFPMPGGPWFAKLRGLDGEARAVRSVDGVTLDIHRGSEDADSGNSLLPMAVEFRGNNVKSIEPRKVELQKAGVDGSEEVVVVCDEYRPQVEVTAYYQMTNTTRELVLRPLTASAMTQMIISRPMLFASLAGGLIGGLLRLFKGPKWRAGRVGRYLAEGAAVGLVTVTMLLSGLLHGQLAGMAAQPQLVLAFSLAAAAGSVGAHFLDAAINRLRGKPAS